jgi:hypothetical protein
LPDDWLMRPAERRSQTYASPMRGVVLERLAGIPMGFAKSRGGLIFVNEPAKEGAAAHVLGCCRSLERDRAVRR